MTDGEGICVGRTAIPSTSRNEDQSFISYTSGFLQYGGPREMTLKIVVDSPEV